MNDSTFAGQVALVTGAASGIGAATVRRLAAAGCTRLALIDRDQNGLQALASALPHTECLLRVHDVADPDAWAVTESELKARFGQLDLAVVNAGVAAAAAITEMPFAEWRRVMSVNLDGAFLTLQSAMRTMGASERGGAIVVVASVAALKPEPGVAAYGASKAGVAHLSRIAAREGVKQRIRVNTVLPGGVETPIWRVMPFFQQLVATEGSEEKAFIKIGGLGSKLGRYARAEEIAEHIAWLLSPGCANVTGSEFVCDGGYLL
jgi:2-keto-3-deoxy-L-fuconate dehydrogenase